VSFVERSVIVFFKTGETGPDWFYQILVNESDFFYFFLKNSLSVLIPVYR
jgi:hypothetical protein